MRSLSSSIRADLYERLYDLIDQRFGRTIPPPPNVIAGNSPGDAAKKLKAFLDEHPECERNTIGLIDAYPIHKPPCSGLSEPTVPVAVKQSEEPEEREQSTKVEEPAPQTNVQPQKARIPFRPNRNKPRF